MSMHIVRFLDRIKAAESRSQRDVNMTVSEARDLHADITKLLLALEQLRQSSEQKQSEPFDIVVSGGNF
jgi:hypothetical protein